MTMVEETIEEDTLGRRPSFLEAIGTSNDDMTPSSTCSACPLAGEAAKRTQDYSS